MNARMKRKALYCKLFTSLLLLTILCLHGVFSLLLSNLNLQSFSEFTVQTITFDIHFVYILAFDFSVHITCYTVSIIKEIFNYNHLIKADIKLEYKLKLKRNIINHRLYKILDFTNPFLYSGKTEALVE